MSQRRKLTAILSADVVGYSRLMGQDEHETVDTLQSYRAAIQDRVVARQGRVVNAPGDALLAEFPSAIEAVRCASEIQGEIERRNAALSQERQMRFRIGVNLGDVIEEADGTLYGDGVNVAARLESLAEPGGVCISGKVFDEVDGRVDFAFESAGTQTVKNIAKPIRVYRLRRSASDVRHPVRLAIRRTWHWPVFASIVVVTLVAGAVTWWRSRGPSSSEELAASAPIGLTVAVLPFVNMSGDPTQEFFADGITEQIITELARFRDLSVIARNATFSYKGKAVDVRQVGKELGIRYVVEGSVQRRADLVRVTVQLLDARSGAHLWAETYERDLIRTKVFGVQDDITGRVVTAIGDAHGAISRATFAASSSKGTASLDAYECVLRYYAFTRTNAPEDHARVRDCLERAVKLAPSYAEAWAALADIYTMEYADNFNPRTDSLGRAVRAARRAVNLDPANARAYVMLAQAQFFLHDMDAFDSTARHAVALNPNNVDVLAFYGLFWTYSHLDDPVKRAEGADAMKKAIALSPIYPTWYHFPIAWHHYHTGDYVAALAEAKRIEMPDYFWTHATLTVIYGAMDRREDARASVARLLELYPEFPKTARQEWHKWNTPNFIIDKLFHDLRRAGLDVPEGA